MAVSLLRFPESPEKPAQDPHPSHPGHLLRHPSVGSTLPLSYALMPALLSGQAVFPASSLGMDSHRLPGDQPIFDQLLDLLTGVGIDNFIGLIGIQPGPPPPAAEDTEASLFCILSILMAAAAAAKGKSPWSL